MESGKLVGSRSVILVGDDLYGKFISHQAIVLWINALMSVWWKMGDKMVNLKFILNNLT